MGADTTPQRDPLYWSALIALGFLALTWLRLTTPSKMFFDEIHYIPAARMMLTMAHPANAEHPLLGKEIIAAGIRLFGDNALGWRVFSWIFGSIGLFAFGRALWWASQRRFAALAGMLLLGTNFIWFIESRIAMLDMFMAALAMIALWQLAAAVRRPGQGARWRLAAAGLCLGLSLGAKWSVAPLMLLPGLSFLALKIRDNGARFLTARAGGPVPGITLIEAALWLGLLPLAAYWATYLPAFLYAKDAISPFAFIEHHRHMLDLQDSVKKLHPYRSVWYQWAANARAVWYLYENIDGAQRGVVLIGNPFTMLAGLPAVLWCLWAGLMRARRDALACALLYIAALGFWALTSKPIQFYYHYLLPGSFLMACLALALDDLRARGQQRLVWAVLALAAAMFVWFHPIISAAPLAEGKMAFEKWMWLKSWR